MTAERSVEQENLDHEAIATLNEYLKLGERFENPPEVTLTLASQTTEGEMVGARDISITTAVQCYAPGVAEMKPRRSGKMQSIAQSTLEAGHHTTRMHPTYMVQIVDVTRSTTHDIFHQHPYYNSEQQSQRYVIAKEGAYVVPTGLTPEQEAVYREAGDFANRAYYDLLEILQPEIDKRLHAMYPEQGWRTQKTEERLESKGKKIAQEVARYALPIGQHTIYYHTLNELQILRLFHASRQPHFNDESRYVIARMIQEISQYDETILQELENPPDPEPADSFFSLYVTDNRDEFDAVIGENSSRLVGHTTNARELLATMARNAISLKGSEVATDEVLEHLLDPKHNFWLSDVYDAGMHDPFTESLRGVTYTWATKLSHTADSQRQRHRRTPGVTPPLENLYNHEPDYIAPMIVRENPELKAKYDEIMNRIYENVERVLESGVPAEWALQLLPNAHAVRLYEQGDLFDWQHRIKQRLCYLAQEEIFFVSVEQAEQMAEIIPELKNLLIAPCGLRQRAGSRPRCPEGDRFCGVPVFNMQIQNYKDKRLV